MSMAVRRMAITTYNQDNELSWMDWKWTKKQKNLFEFTSKLIRLRQEIPILSRRRFFGTDQVSYLLPEGGEMTGHDFDNPRTHCLALFMDGQRVTEQTEDGQDIGDQQLLWILNAYWGEIPFKLPKIGCKNSKWQVLVDSFTGTVHPTGDPLAGGEAYVVQPRSSMLFRLV